MKRWERLSQVEWLALLAAISLVLRLLWVFSVHNAVLVGDSPWYDARAVALAGGEGYHVNGVPTAFFPVGYPFFLAAVYTLFGHSFLAAKLANVMLGVVICLLTSVMGDRVFGACEGRIAGLLMAIYPNQIFYTSLLMSELLFSCLLLVFLILWVHGLSNRGREKWYFWTSAGFVMGLLVLVRPPVLLLSALLTLWHALRRRAQFRTLLLSGLVVFTFTLLTITPWTVRNYLVFGQFVLVSTNGGINFWFGNNARSFGAVDFENVPAEVRSRAQFSANEGGIDEVAADRAGYMLAMQFIREHPGQMLQNLPRKLMRFFYAEVEGLLMNAGVLTLHSPKQVLGAMRRLPIVLPDAVKPLLAVISQLFYSAIILFALMGIGWHIAKGNERIEALFGTVLYWVMIHLIYIGGGRFRFPIMPLLTLFSAATLVLWSRKRSEPRQS